MTPKLTKYVVVTTFLWLALVTVLGLWNSYLRIPLWSSSVKASRAWDIGDLGKVRMLIENTKRYQLDTEDGGRDWESLIPEDGGIIKKRDPDTGELKEYTVSMFHELRCLNVIRLEVTRPSRFESPAPPVVTHCLNYVRQAVLCRSDLYLENVKAPIGPHDVDITHVRTCKDWRKVYNAASNQHTFENLQK